MIRVVVNAKRKVYRRISMKHYLVFMWVSQFDIKLLKFHISKPIFINTFEIKLYFYRKEFLNFYFYMDMFKIELIAQSCDKIWLIVGLKKDVMIKDFIQNESWFPNNVFYINMHFFFFLDFFKNRNVELWIYCKIWHVLIMVGIMKEWYWHFNIEKRQHTLWIHF